MGEVKEFAISKEFETPDFNSAWPEKRFRRTMETLGREQSIWGSRGTRAESKAVYRLPENEKFDGAGVKRCYRETAVRRIAENGNKIPAARDTAGISYAGHKKTEGPGYGRDKTLVINPHTRLAVTPDRIVLGILDK